MKSIEFKNQSSIQIYTDYMNRIKRMTSKLNKVDRDDILMEFNSHIYESMQHKKDDDEVANLLAVTKELGTPEEVLVPLIAEKTLIEATKTFNPFTVAKAIALNISNGLIYIVFALLYLGLFGFGYAIFAKIRNPFEVGMFFDNGKFEVLGNYMKEGVRITTKNASEYGCNEVLGIWYIPVMLFSAVVLYFIITLLLKLKHKLK